MRPHRFVKVRIVRRRTRGGRLVMRWRDTAGLPREQAIPRRIKNRRAAEAFAGKFELALNGLAEQVVEPIAFERLTQEFLAARKVRGLRPRSLKTYASIFADFARIVRPPDADRIGPHHIERYLAGRPVSTTTRRRDWVHLKALFGWAVKVGHLAENPVLKVDAPRAPAPTPFAYTEQQANAILDAAATRPLWAHAAIRLALKCGLRIGELAALKPAHIDWQRHLLLVPAQKSAKDRLVCFDPETGGALFELRCRDERMLWGTPDSPFFSRDYFDKALGREVRATCQEAKVPQPKKPTQDLRRTFGTILARAGTPPSMLQEVMGHASFETTRRFYLATDAESAAARGRQDMDRALSNAASDERAKGGKLVAKERKPGDSRP
ncbi:MAG TPA: site-specific integrase [Phycisphaerae bacterium]|nr:site-specific integrase [Phycisphaerae bacterium]